MPVVGTFYKFTDKLDIKLVNLHSIFINKHKKHTKLCDKYTKLC